MDGQQQPLPPDGQGDGQAQGGGQAPGAQAGPNLATFDTIMGGVMMEIRALGLVSKIKTFAGLPEKNVSEKFRAWLKDMNRVCRALNASPDRVRATALSSLSGAAAEHLSRFLTSNPQAGWPQIRATLAAKYLEESDMQMAQRNLHALKQQQNELVEDFCDKIEQYAEDAYPGHNLNDPIVQVTMVQVFIDGVRDDAMMKKLLRDRPATLDAARRIAVQEQRATRAFNITRRREEPMDVDVTTKKESRVDELEKQVQELKKKLEDQEKRSVATTVQNPYKHEWASDGQPICSYCREPGHIYRICSKRLNKGKNSAHLN